MQALEPGHTYEVEDFDCKGAEAEFHRQRIYFMKRVGKGYPGNTGEPHGGTNCQEVLRMLIDRIKYLDGQVSCDENKRMIYSLRRVLLEFERRAAIRHGEEDLYPLQLWDVEDVPVEDFPTCRTCGHMFCKGHGEEKHA